MRQTTRADGALCIERREWALIVVCVPCAWSMQVVVSLALANIPHGNSLTTAEVPTVMDRRFPELA
uniref:Uncharacterized protein n=1 Tax=mine drainage metagenome TaxID=410659 RepID=E6PPQ7_9ZZZZ